MKPSHGLRNISEIRTFFRTNEDPIYFFGPTAFNLLGLDRWVILKKDPLIGLSS